MPQRVRIDVLIETFHGSDHFRSVPISCDRYERASILSTDSFLISAGEALEQVAEKQWWHARATRVRTFGTSPVCLVHLVDLVYFVYLVDLVHLVSFVQPKTRQTRQTRQTKQRSSYAGELCRHPAKATLSGPSERGSLTAEPLREYKTRYVL